MPPADLALPLLGGLALLCGAGGVAAAAAARRPWGDRAAAMAAIVLAGGLAVAVAATLATTVLRAGAPAALLAAAIGALAVGATCAWRPRGPAAGAALVPMAAAAVLLLRGLPGAPEGGAPAGLGPLLDGTHPLLAQRFGLELLCLAVGAWGSWWAVREGHALPASGAAAVVVVADLVNVPGGRVGPAFWPVGAAVALGVALAAWTQQERVRRGWRARRVAPLAGTGRRPWPTLAAGALALTGAAIALPPLNAVNFSGRFFQYGSPGGTQRAPRRAADVVGYSESVIPGGPLRSVETPLLTYTTGARGRGAYLRGVVLEDFVGGDWYPRGGEARRVEPAVHPRALAVLPVRGPSLRDRHAVRLTIRLLPGAGQGLADVLYPGAPSDLPASATPLVVSGRRAGGGLAGVTAVRPVGGLGRVDGGGPITTIGTVSTATASELRRAGTRYPAAVRPDARLPAADAAEAAVLRRIARRMTRGARDPYIEAIDVQDALRAQETYDLAPPPAPVGTWPILYFLQVSHLGYCQYFASSMGALLRALGVPVRLVNGFGPGEEGFTRSGARLITAADAHTWVQVFFPGYGWIGFEPTPDGFYRGRGEPAPSRTRAPGPVQVHPIVPAGTRPTSPVAPPPRLPHPPAAVPAARIAALTGIGLLAAMALGLLGLLVALRRRVRTPLAARRRLLVLCWAAGRDRGRARTLAELLAAVRAACGLGPDDPAAAALGRLVALADRAAFAAGPASQVAPADWRAAWSSLRPRYPRLLWSAWRARGRPLRAGPGRGVRPAVPAVPGRAG